VPQRSLHICFTFPRSQSTRQFLIVRYFEVVLPLRKETTQSVKIRSITLAVHFTHHSQAYECSRYTTELRAATTGTFARRRRTSAWIQRKLHT